MLEPAQFRMLTFLKETLPFNHTYRYCVKKMVVRESLTHTQSVTSCNTACGQCLDKTAPTLSLFFHIKRAQISGVCVICTHQGMLSPN